LVILTREKRGGGKTKEMGKCEREGLHPSRKPGSADTPGNRNALMESRGGWVKKEKHMEKRRRIERYELKQVGLWGAWAFRGQGLYNKSSTGQNQRKGRTDKGDVLPYAKLEMNFAPGELSYESPKKGKVRGGKKEDMEKGVVSTGWNEKKEAVKYRREGGV